MISPTPTIDHKQVATYVFQTIEAMKPTATKTQDPNTLLATNAASTIAALENAFIATTTAMAGAANPTPIPTQPKPPTALPTIPVVPVVPCDKMSFVSDISTPDGTVLKPHQGFQKIWRIKNSGSCTWTPTYQFVFVTGDQMGAPAAVPLGKNVFPGDTIDIVINLTAPAFEGKYRGYWRMRNASGIFFGMGQTGHDAIWVDIKVEAETIPPPPPPPPLPKKGCVVQNSYIDWWVDGRFTAIFTVKNTGSETWDTSNFDVAYLSGEDDFFDDDYFPTRFDLPQTVTSGNTTTIKIEGYDVDKGDYQFQSKWGIVKGAESYCVLVIDY